MYKVAERICKRMELPKGVMSEGRISERRLDILVMQEGKHCHNCVKVAKVKVIAWYILAPVCTAVITVEIIVGV